MEIEPSVILLTAIYFSGTYAGCFSAILYRIPGEPMDVPMLWDGYTMARRGAPAKALGWALVAALIGGLVSSAVMVALAGPMGDVALKFDSPDYFAAVFFGLTTVVALAGKSMVNSLISLCVGLLVATVGIDSIYGTDRFSFGVPILRDGVQLVEVLVGMYGLGEVLTRIGQGLHIEQPKETSQKVSTQFPTLRELLDDQDHAIPQHGCSAPCWASCPAPAPPSPPSSPTASRSNTAGGGICWAPACRKASSRRRSAPPLRSPAT